MIETPDANLSRGMRQLNGVYTQARNKRYNKTGHLFQGRYKAIVIQKDTHKQELRHPVEKINNIDPEYAVYATISTRPPSPSAFQ